LVDLALEHEEVAVSWEAVCWPYITQRICVSADGLIAAVEDVHVHPLVEATLLTQALTARNVCQSFPCRGPFSRQGKTFFLEMASSKILTIPRLGIAPTRYMRVGCGCPGLFLNNLHGLHD
jgi:hypothetical protein